MTLSGGFGELWTVKTVSSKVEDVEIWFSEIVVMNR